MTDAPQSASTTPRNGLALVTGGAGFIGSHLVDALSTAGLPVRVLDDLSSGRRENLESAPGEVEFVEGDIRDLSSVRSACDGVDIVFHLAAVGSVPRSMKDPAHTFSVNVGGTANVFSGARDAGARRVVYASSSSIYGDSESLPKREGEEGRPLSPYALSKHMNEELADVFARCYAMELIGLRYFNVFGPRQLPDGPYAAVIPRFFKACLSGESPEIYGDGSQSRDFTFVADAVKANLLAASAPTSACGRAYNVAGGSGVTVNDLARKVLEVVGAGSSPRHEAPRSGDIKHSLADLTRARTELGYEPTTELSSGLAASLEYYRGTLAGARPGRPAGSSRP
jgi:UDP-N-acetylglucosamine/UDP-N-acetylgalactosamine 4-epimerase